ncbi:hypothetical protein AB0K43_17495 [Kitasatospora sp. NPDC049258]|uniref:hypothetical protein n=1 Tax=Kitasatospora sp. NPDC049258 TaxID=3155394 RepID=UPI0034359B6E
MSNLFAIAYPDPATARQVRDEAIALQKQKLIELEDIVVVERRDDGRIIQTSLTTEEEEHLREAVKAAQGSAV